MGWLGALILGAILLIIAGSYLEDVALSTFGYAILGGIWGVVTFLLTGIFWIAVIALIIGALYWWKNN